MKYFLVSAVFLLAGLRAQETITIACKMNETEYQENDKHLISDSDVIMLNVKGKKLKQYTIETLVVTLNNEKIYRSSPQLSACNFEIPGGTFSEDLAFKIPLKQFFNLRYDEILDKLKEHDKKEFLENYRREVEAKEIWKTRDIKFTILRVSNVKGAEVDFSPQGFSFLAKAD